MPVAMKNIGTCLYYRSSTNSALASVLVEKDLILKDVCDPGKQIQEATVEIFNSVMLQILTALTISF